MYHSVLTNNHHREVEPFLRSLTMKLVWQTCKSNAVCLSLKPVAVSPINICCLFLRRVHFRLSNGIQVTMLRLNSVYGLQIEQMTSNSRKLDNQTPIRMNA